MKERIRKIKSSKKKGFTLIEIVVIIAIMAILALILVPNLTAWVQKGNDTKTKANMKSVHNAAELVRQTEGSLDEDRIKEFSNNQDVIVSEGVIADEDLEADKYTVTNKGGQTVVKYKTQEGKVFTFPDVSNVNNGETGGSGGSGESEDPNHGNEYLADDSEFEWVPDDTGYPSTNEAKKGYYKYIGIAETVKIPHIIHGHKMTSYYKMFVGTNVEKVVSNNPNITNMSYMFQNSKATTLNLSSFNTSKVTNMIGMFKGSQATTLDLSSFNTSKVTDMTDMFRESQAASLDLSSFDTSQVTYMYAMFHDSPATTGYARTQADADKFNVSARKPSRLSFTVK